MGGGGERVFSKVPKGCLELCGQGAVTAIGKRKFTLMQMVGIGMGEGEGAGIEVEVAFRGCGVG